MDSGFCKLYQQLSSQYKVAYRRLNFDIGASTLYWTILMDIGALTLYSEFIILPFSYLQATEKRR